jgi:16S rRNA (cytidine1402-2'-O)-methyltransferase
MGPDVNHRIEKLPAGLYFVATPIGTARDITLRALDILASADVIAAEDTRTMRRLLDIHGIALGDRPLLAYHDHNGAQIRPKLLAFLAQGKAVAYGSEAGTPLIADPGFGLSQAAVEAGALVTSAPGPSAIIAALTLAGLPTDRFFFGGFLPNTQSQRRAALQNYCDVPGTLVFYESPKRIRSMIVDAQAVLGEGRQAVICRELTKKFEECRRGTLSELVRDLATLTLKGEIVVLIDRAHLPVVKSEDIEQSLRQALTEHSLRDASDLVANALGVPRRQVYQMALTIGRQE